MVLMVENPVFVIRKMAPAKLFRAVLFKNKEF